MLDNVGYVYLSDDDGKGLLACPVCGKKDMMTLETCGVAEWRGVICDRCGLVMDGYSEEELVWKWNRREGLTRLVKAMQSLAQNSIRLRYYLEALAIVTGMEKDGEEFVDLIKLCLEENRVYDEHRGEILEEKDPWGSCSCAGFGEESYLYGSNCGSAVGDKGGKTGVAGHVYDVVVDE